jgi:hypothetical protein
LETFVSTDFEEKSKMTKRINSTARGKRPGRSGPSESNPKTPSNPFITPEEALRRSKLSNAQKQAEAEAARDAADRAKQEYKDSWWKRDPQAKCRSPYPYSTSAGSEFEDLEDEEDKKSGAAPSTGSAERFFKAESETGADSTGKKKIQTEAERNERRKKEKRQRKMREENRKFKEDIEPTVEVNWPQKSSKRTQTQYEQWAEDCAAFFANPEAGVEQFPTPKGFRTCWAKVCVKSENLGFCHHQLRELLKESDEYEVAWLKKERLRWQPDKFLGREEVQALAQEMFQVMQRLIDGDRKGKVDE